MGCIDSRPARTEGAVAHTLDGRAPWGDHVVPVCSLVTLLTKFGGPDAQDRMAVWGGSSAQALADWRTRPAAA